MNDVTKDTVDEIFANIFRKNKIVKAHFTKSELCGLLKISSNGIDAALDYIKSDKKYHIENYKDEETYAITMPGMNKVKCLACTYIYDYIATIDTDKIFLASTKKQIKDYIETIFSTGQEYSKLKLFSSFDTNIIEDLKNIGLVTSDNKLENFIFDEAYANVYEICDDNSSCQVETVVVVNKPENKEVNEYDSLAGKDDDQINLEIMNALNDNIVSFKEYLTSISSNLKCDTTEVQGLRQVNEKLIAENQALTHKNEELAQKLYKSTDLNRELTSKNKAYVDANSNIYLAVQESFQKILGSFSNEIMKIKSIQKWQLTDATLDKFQQNVVEIITNEMITINDSNNSKQQ